MHQFFCYNSNRGLLSKSTLISGRHLALALSLVFCLATISTSVFAQQKIAPPVTHGWDVKDDPKATGEVKYNVISKPGRRPILQITYNLKGAKPLQKYDLAFGLFGLPGDGLKSFGVPRFLRETHTRELITATLDAFVVGKFQTDRFGNGQTHVELTLAGVPAGTYNAQFTWTRLADLRAYYRTGATFGQDFAQIVVP
jgi:hypothetical protein